MSDMAALRAEEPISDIRNLTRSGQVEEACTRMEDFLSGKFPFEVVAGSLRFDLESSVALNSLRASFKTECGQYLFLKCHHEDGEAGRVGEYYRAGILEEAGFPIDTALYQASEVGEQLVIYNYQDRQKTPELHDVARDIEARHCKEDEMAPVLAVYEDFQKLIGQRYLASLHEASREEVEAEAVHALFHRRLVDDEHDVALGARVKEFYLGRDMELPDIGTISFDEFIQLRWKINGKRYDVTIADILARAQAKLKPSLLPLAAVTAHGDDHTANLLYDPAAGNIKYFDPAFAGHHIPALQAGCKALYHCVFAHPNMLYDPAEFNVSVSARIKEGVLTIKHNWDLTKLRQGFLKAQLEHLWQPLMSALQEKDMLADDWEETVRLTLFCCPVLCKNLIAGAGAPNPLTPEASLMTFAIAVQLAAEPLEGKDRVSDFFEKLKTGVKS